LQPLPAFDRHFCYLRLRTSPAPNDRTEVSRTTLVSNVGGSLGGRPLRGALARTPKLVFVAGSGQGAMCLTVRQVDTQGGEAGDGKSPHSIETESNRQCDEYDTA